MGVTAATEGTATRAQAPARLGAMLLIANKVSIHGQAKAAVSAGRKTESPRDVQDAPALAPATGGKHAQHAPVSCASSGRVCQTNEIHGDSEPPRMLCQYPP